MDSSGRQGVGIVSSPAPLSEKTAMPSKPNPAAVLAVNLVRHLQTHCELHPHAYPVTLSQLAAIAAPDIISADDYPKAVKHKSFTSRVVVAQKKNSDSLIALVEDVERMATSDALLLTLLEQSCSPEA